MRGGKGVGDILHTALGAREGAGGGAGEIDGAVGRHRHVAGRVAADGADIGDRVGADAGAIVGER